MAEGKYVPKYSTGRARRYALETRLRARWRRHRARRRPRSTHPPSPIAFCSATEAGRSSRRTGGYAAAGAPRGAPASGEPMLKPSTGGWWRSRGSASGPLTRPSAMPHICHRVRSAHSAA
eukprot:4673700-Pleurochrysis_carterae.AAC.1